MVPAILSDKRFHVQKQSHGAIPARLGMRFNVHNNLLGRPDAQRGRQHKNEMEQSTNPVASAERWNPETRCGGATSHDASQRKPGTFTHMTARLPLTMVEPPHRAESPWLGGTRMMRMASDTNAEETTTDGDKQKVRAGAARQTMPPIPVPNG